MTVFHEHPRLAAHILPEPARLMSQHLRSTSRQLVEYLESDDLH